MQLNTASKGKLWTGRVLCAFAALFLFVDAGMKLAMAPLAVQGTIELGYPRSTVFGIGAVLLVSTLLFAIPRTSIFGAVLLTGYLGGAIATHVRVGNPLFSHILFPIYVAVMIWGGLYLRDHRLRILISSNS